MANNSLIPNYNRKRVSDRTIDELIGLAKGITADNIVHQAEAEFLSSWLKNNMSYTDDKIINTLYCRVEEMLKDNYLDQDEQQELLELLKSITGSHLPAQQAATTATTFPLDNPVPPITFDGATFVLTGKFAYAPRKICSQVITERGGVVRSKVSGQTDYLVIGTLSSPDWIHTSYGRKIEDAMNLRDSGSSKRIAIIHEDHWIQ